MSGTVTIINLKPKKVFVLLGCIAILLVLLSIAGQVAKYQFGYSKQFVIEFFLDEENNIPTYYSTVILLFSSVLLGAIGVYKKGKRDAFWLHWSILAVIFFIMSIDEAASLHERLSFHLRNLLGVSGFFRFAWIIPGMIFVLILAIAYLRFLLQLPRKTQLLFILAGTLYVSGVLGIELIGGRYHYIHGWENFTYSMITTVEETLEMVGIIVFIYALLDYIGHSEIQILFSAKE